MNGYKYHVHQLPAGWIGLVASETGLRRATLKPTLQDVLEDLGDDIDGAEHDPDYFADVVDCLARYSEGDLSALDDIELDLTACRPSSGPLGLLAGRFRLAKRAATVGWRRRPATQGHARRRAGHGPQPLLANHPLPPRHFQRRRSGRLRRRRPRRQGPPVADGSWTRHRGKVERAGRGLCGNDG